MVATENSSQQPTMYQISDGLSKKVLEANGKLSELKLDRILNYAILKNGFHILFIIGGHIQILNEKNEQVKILELRFSPRVEGGQKVAVHENTIYFLDYNHRLLKVEFPSVIEDQKNIQIKHEQIDQKVRDFELTKTKEGEIQLIKILFPKTVETCGEKYNFEHSEELKSINMLTKISRGSFDRTKLLVVGRSFLRESNILV